METLLLLLFIGVGLGSTYGLVGLSLVSIQNATGLFNLAQGEAVMLGAVLAYGLISVVGIPYPLSVLLIIVGAVVLGLFVNWILVSPLLKRDVDHITIVIGTYSVGLVIVGITGELTDYAFVAPPPLLSMSQYKIGFFPIVPQYAVAIIAALLLSVSYWYFINKTYTGWALKATSYNADMCKLLGISSDRMIALAFVIAAVISAVAGIVSGPLGAANAEMGFPLLLKGFIAAVVGGMGNPLAAMVGGLTIGILHVMVSGYLAPGYAELAVFLFLILTLYIRPHGIFGVRD
ncbi:MAG: branched-chain amino acid ABC transporter permease [Deltaproteobacteria bacterium]|nr:branched-chain amino acid ABC transporter permease [Deltaproteobacteria bacterium]